MENLILLDRITRVAPLGLSFWDPVSNGFVTDGLQVTAIPKTDFVYRGKPAMALPNRSGIFAFHHLPGLTEAENGVGDHDYWNPLPAQPGEVNYILTPKDFIVTVKDRHKQFLPFKFSVKAPKRRQDAWSLPGPGTVPSLVSSESQGVIPLFSSPARSIPPGAAVIRASITMGKRPAAWAMVEAFSQNSQADPDDISLVARGIANQDGQAVLIIQYPKFMSVEAGQNMLPLTAQKWFISLKVFFSPKPFDPEIPDLSEIAGQTETRLISLEPPGEDTPAGKACLKYGRELILKTENQSELQIEAIS